MRPTIREVLELPVLQAGDPEVINGAGVRAGGALDRSIRWVHVSDLPDLSDLLEGGELVLTTGAPLADPAHRGDYLAGLSAAGAVAVVIELGRYLDGVPDEVRRAARELAMPVVVLHRTVRFVEVTEQVHRRIVADQYAEVDYARRVHDVFTALSMRRADVDEIVGAAAGMLETPVVLEDLNHQVLAFAARDVPTRELLGDWERRSRLASPGPTSGPTSTPAGSWAARPVGPHRQEWGRLVAPRVRVDPAGERASEKASEKPGEETGEEAGEKASERAEETTGDRASDRVGTTLERAAQALALHRMIERDRTSLELRAQSGLLDDLRRGRVRDEADATARAYALGLRPALTYLPMAVRLSETPNADDVVVQQRRLRSLDAVVHTARAAGHTVLAAGGEHGHIDLLLAPRRRAAVAGAPAARPTDEELEQLCAQIRRAVVRVAGVSGCVVGVGPESGLLVEAATGLGEAAHVAEVAAAMPQDSGRSFFRIADIRLRGLVTLIRNDPRVQAFAETELRGLLRHRARLGSDGGEQAFDLLRNFLDVGGNKTELAKRLHLSRPTLYARLAGLQRLLGVDLDDAESRTSLHVAMLILERSAVPVG
ncbi:PucR family transcriptional regulator [Mycolicibacterium palauense]|uniref:PucR family transcriptional regulator n=1 Tax=Mycolicibacterium palauense TaxID=2034511 RepID=UPI000BFECFE6|nr:PucR family transcriptional regulator [Mycolicibacterium palauense]